MKKACLYSIFLTNDQILTKMTQIIHSEDLKGDGNPDDYYVLYERS